MKTLPRLRSRDGLTAIARFAPARLATLLLLAAGLLAAPRAGAELVVLTDGEVLKIEAFEAQETRAKLTFRDGGTLVLPIGRIERVLDDEIVPAVAPEVAPPSVEVTAPAFPVRFDSLEPVPQVPFGALLYEAAKRHDLHPRIVVELARAESNFRATAVSYKGAVGILQLMPATGRRFGLERAELFDPKKNAEAGARYFSWLLRRFGDDLSKALAGYNAGEGAVDRFAGIPPYRETRIYIRKILTALADPAAGGAAPKRAS